MDYTDTIVGFTKSSRSGPATTRRDYSEARAEVVTKAEEAKRLRDAAEKVEAEIAAEEAAKEAESLQKELVADVLNAKELVGAGVLLLEDISLLISGSAANRPPSELYAKHRKGLNELARKYGYKLVIVGNRTKATLVRA